jgi:hypothetical protein
MFPNLPNPKAMDLHHHNKAQARSHQAPVASAGADHITRVWQVNIWRCGKGVSLRADFSPSRPILTLAPHDGDNEYPFRPLGDCLVLTVWTLAYELLQALDYSPREGLHWISKETPDSFPKSTENFQLFSAPLALCASIHRLREAKTNVELVWDKERPCHHGYVCYPGLTLATVDATITRILASGF